VAFEVIQCWAVLDFYEEPLVPVCMKIEPGAGSGLKNKVKSQFWF
jgi:hypothetical protein